MARRDLSAVDLVRRQVTLAEGPFVVGAARGSFHKWPGGNEHALGFAFSGKQQCRKKHEAHHARAASLANASFALRAVP